jgi:hypothetical protein
MLDPWPSMKIKLILEQLLVPARGKKSPLASFQNASTLSTIADKIIEEFFLHPPLILICQLHVSLGHASCRRSSNSEEIQSSSGNNGA